MSEEKKKYDGMHLKIRLQNRPEEGQAKGEVVGEFSMFGKDASKGLRSADPQTFTVTDAEGKERKVPKLVAFVNDGDISIYQTNELAKTKGKEKGERVGVLFAREYEKDGAKRVFLTGYFDNNGIAKGAKLSETPFQAAASLFGPGAEQILGNLLGVNKARLEKRNAAAPAAAEAAEAAPAMEAPSAAEPESKGPTLDF